MDLISAAAARRAILSERNRIWKDSGSIQGATIGEPMICRDGRNSCVCIEANARNSYGGYEGIRRTIAVFSPAGGFDMIDGGTKGFQDYCQSLKPFPELEGQRMPKGR